MLLKGGLSVPGMCPTWGLYTHLFPWAVFQGETRRRKPAILDNEGGLATHSSDCQTSLSRDEWSDLTADRKKFFRWAKSLIDIGRRFDLFERLQPPHEERVLVLPCYCAR